MDQPSEITRAGIEAARARIAQDIRVTPTWRLPGAALVLPCAEVWLKLEQLQVSGSFKARGMFNRLRSAAIPAAGVTIASGGNAGIAAATAAWSLGVPCEVYLPEVSSAAKRERLASLGANIVVHGASYVDALEACVARQAQTGALMMHAYDQAEVVEGAGTLAAEIEEACGVPDRVLVSVGGGGLIAGIAACFGSRSRVTALEPALAPTLYAAREAGRPVDVEVSGIAADSLGARRIGRIAWQVCSHHVAEAVLLEDADIRGAQQRLWRELRLAVEPAASLPLAALWSRALVPAPHERVAVVLCGANLDLATLR